MINIVPNYSNNSEPIIKKVEFDYLEAISKGERNILTSDGFLVLLTNEFIKKIKVQLDEKDYKICQEVIIVSNIIQAEDLDMQTYIKYSCILGMDNLEKIFIKLDENKGIGGLLCF
ncbi:hypothetical protein [Fusobacterium gastrosuis]|uniref:hypothetical protein n=1 Tax=Fusobacterium gastrosuis TaxID=1755100 RepID=UPI002979E4D4|nr:hypothetical protein [Fusobacteriaceae bacterium]MDY5714193.1 hypothetical protein [Fusobacterium gastrosuis]